MSERTMDPAVLNRWIGRSETAEDTIDVRQARLMEAVLGREPQLGAGDPLPPLWHWLYFPVARPPSELGRDGHPRLGGFLPPVGLPRRMWAGGRFAFEEPLRVGEPAIRHSTIRSVDRKSGRTGELCFVCVAHQVRVGDRVCFTEEHDIVYREDPGPGARSKAPPAPPEGAEWSRTVTPDPVTLFRYSALTFNGHRIHYDRIYCREVEGYPDLVVHGPLIATLLVGFGVENGPGRPLAQFRFRAVSPVFDSRPFAIKGRRTDDAIALWAETADGALAMEAQATFR